MSDDVCSTVRVRASAPDPFAGLKGMDYIKARGLKPRPNHTEQTPCAHCALMEFLPDVQRLMDNWFRDEVTQ